MIGLRLQPSDLAPLDAYVAAQDERSSRPQAIRAILADWLRTHGFGPSKGVKPSGPATEVVEAMEAAIQKHRASKRKPTSAS